MGKLSEAQKEAIRELRENGKTLGEIGEVFGISESAVQWVLKPDYFNEKVKEWHKNHPGYNNEKAREWRENYPSYYNEKIKKWWRVQRANLIALLGGKCANCGCEDSRILQLNHIGGEGGKDRQRYSNELRLYAAILSGKRSREDFNILCSNCNAIYEYEMGRRKVGTRYYKLRVQVIQKMGNKCVSCGLADLRVLQVNHINGCSKEERRKYRNPYYFCRDILNGTRPTDDLDLRCGNCNTLYEYETGRRTS